MKLSKHLAMTGAVLAGAVALAACGVDVGSDEPDSSTVDAAGTPADAAADADGDGGGEDDLFNQELADRLPSEIAEAGVMTWVGHVNPPTRIATDGGGYEGVESDLAAAAGEILGVEIEFVDGGGLGDILLALESGRYDFFIGPLKSTFERQEQFDFIVWLLTEATYVFPAGADGPGLASVEDLCGLRVSIVGAGVLNDFTTSLSADCEARGEEPIVIEEFGDREGAILAVDSGRADAHGTTLTTALHYQGLKPDTYDIVSAPIGDEPDALGAVISKTRPELGELMHDVFQEIFDLGIYDDIVEEWNLGEAAVDEPRWNYAFD